MKEKVRKWIFNLFKNQILAFTKPLVNKEVVQYRIVEQEFKIEKLLVCRRVSAGDETFMLMVAKEMKAELFQEVTKYVKVYEERNSPYFMGTDITLELFVALKK